MLLTNTYQTNLEHDSHRIKIYNRVIEIVNSYYEKDMVLGDSSQNENENMDYEME